MTDPVDTNGLRSAASEIIGYEPNFEMRWAVYELSFAAADELDRLRTIEAVDVTVLTEQRNAERRHVAHLRAVIESAPHGDNCFGIGVLFPDQETLDRMCTCWKADVF